MKQADLSSAPAEKQRERRRRFDAYLRVAVLILASAFLIFAHGCHGDEDNELFALVRQVSEGCRR